MRTVAAHPDATVIAVDQVTGVLRVDPERMVVRVNFGVTLEERPARIVGDGQLSAENIDPFFVIRIDADLAVVHGPRIQAVNLRPGFALVFGAKYAAFLVLDGRIHDVGVAAEDVEADSPHRTLGKAVAQLPPGAPTVDGLVDPAMGTPAVEAPRTASALIGRGIQHLGIGRVHRQIDRAGVLIQAEHVLPVPSAVDRHEHSTLRVCTPQVSERGYVDDIGILRVDDDAADVVRLAKPHVLPCPAAVGRLVDAIAPRGALSVVGFARANPDDVVICRVDGHVADGHRGLAVKDVHPGVASVHGLQEAARSRRGVEDRRILLVNRQVNGAPAHEGRSDFPGPEVVEKRVRDLGQGWCRGDDQKEGQRSQRHQHDHLQRIADKHTQTHWHSTERPRRGRCMPLQGSAQCLSESPPETRSTCLPRTAPRREETRAARTVDPK